RVPLTQPGGAEPRNTTYQGRSKVVGNGARAGEIRGRTRNACSGPSTCAKNGEQLLPLRVHVFHRAIPGLWSCVNPSCDECFDGWPFGGILCEAVDTCPACGGIVLPITICRGCGEPFL